MLHVIFLDVYIILDTFIVVIMIYFFVLDDSSTSKRFTTRTEQLTTSRCYDLLQKLRVRLGTCKSSLTKPVILYYCSFQFDTDVVVLIHLCLGVEFLLAHYVRIHKRKR